MITSNYQVDGDIYSYADKFYCDSHDDKPSNSDAPGGLINGAILEETDTGKTYIFDKKANEWTEKAAGGGGSGGSSTLSGLTDVDISNPSDGQTLVYNATTRKWENVSPNTLYIHDDYDETTGTYTLSETWQTIFDALTQGTLVYITDNYEEQGVGMTASLSLISSAQYYNSEGTYKIMIDGTAGGQFHQHVYEAASPNDYPVAID